MASQVHTMWVALAHLGESSDLFFSTELLLSSLAQALLCTVGVFNELSQMWDVTAEPGRGSVVLLGIVLSPCTFFITLQLNFSLTPRTFGSNMLLYQRKWIIPRILQLCGNCCFPRLLFSCLGRSKLCGSLEKACHSNLCSVPFLKLSRAAICWNQPFPTTGALLELWERQQEYLVYPCWTREPCWLLAWAVTGEGICLCWSGRVIGTRGKAGFQQHLGHGWCYSEPCMGIKASV